MGTVKGFFVARVCFVALPEAVAYGAGLTALPYLPFALIYASIGVVPAAILAWMGDAAISTGSGWMVGLGLVGGGVAAGAGALLFAKMADRQAAAKTPAPAKPDAE